MKLIDNWQQSWKWLSMQASAGVTVLSLTWASMPADIKTPLMGHIEEWAIVILGAAAMFGRIINQTPTPPSDPPK